MLRFFFLIELKGCFCIISDYTYLFNIGWIRIRMDQELLPGSGTQKIQSWSWIWIRIRNKSFRIHNTAFHKLNFFLCSKQLSYTFAYSTICKFIKDTGISAYLAGYPISGRIGTGYKKGSDIQPAIKIYDASQCIL